MVDHMEIGSGNKGLEVQPRVEGKSYCTIYIEFVIIV